MSQGHRFRSLEDFLASTESHVDAVLDDGWGQPFPVKGREIDAVVLFADITAFSTRTIDMTPTETLIYVQNFFAWMTAEALHGLPGIVDKYIGDEVMVVYSTEFGSVDPVVDAVRAATAMSANDFLAYQPHMGIAGGPVVVGYAGTPLRYNVSVFGAPVALAARCAGVHPDSDDDHPISSSIALPAELWAGRDLDEVLPPGTKFQPHHRPFVLQEPRELKMKGFGMVEVQEIYNSSIKIPSENAEDRAQAGAAHLLKHGRYWPAYPEGTADESKTP